MSSDFFVWCFIVVNFEEIWTRPYRDVLVWRTKYNKKWSISTFREKYINWNWLDQAWGRFVAMLCTRWLCCTRWEGSSIFFKDVIKVGFKVLSWWFERNMLVCFFRLLTENGFGFAFITKFSKIFVWTSPGAFDVLKVDVLTMLTSPGAFEILCQVFQNELWRIFLLPCTKVVQVAVFFRENQFINPFKIDVEKWIVQDLLTARELVEVWRWKESFLKPQKFSSFLEWFKLFSLIFGIVVLSSLKMMMN